MPDSEAEELINLLQQRFGESENSVISLGNSMRNKGPKLFFEHHGDHDDDSVMPEPVVYSLVLTTNLCVDLPLSLRQSQPLSGSLCLFSLNFVTSQEKNPVTLHSMCSHRL